MPPSTDRYEFRAFARNFGIAEQRLREWSGAPSIRESSEIYIVSATTGDYNVKIRAGILDVKLLTRRERCLERWSPAFRAPLPVSAEQARKWVFTPLDFPDVHLDAASYDTAALIERVVRPSPGLAAASVLKCRWHFELDGCLCELADISVNGAWTKSICAESVDAEAVITLAGKLGLDAYTNESYVRAIQRITGMIPARDA